MIVLPALPVPAALSSIVADIITRVMPELSFSVASDVQRRWGLTQVQYEEALGVWLHLREVIVASLQDQHPDRFSRLSLKERGAYIHTAGALMHRLIETCPHDLSDIERPRTGGVYCPICRKEFGWWCPKSPDHVCHYFAQRETVGEGTAVSVPLLVELMDGSKVVAPAGADPGYMTSDCCLYCGEPEERK